MDNYHLLAAPFPNPDATQEFKVIGNNLMPAYGFTPGGVVSIVTKSGTNRWHGDLFEFIRNNAVNATEYFTQSTDLIKRNQFGGSIGGPIVKDKLFIFGNYQGTRQHRSVLDRQRLRAYDRHARGNFGAYCQNGFDSNGLCQDTNVVNGVTYIADQLWNPSTDAITNSQGNLVGGTHRGEQSNLHVADVLAHPGMYFPNNQINPATFNQAAASIINLMPTNTIDQYGRIGGIWLAEHQ